MMKSFQMSNYNHKSVFDDAFLEESRRQFYQVQVTETPNSY